MNANEIAEIKSKNWWQDTDASVELIERILGASHVAWLKAQQFPVSLCESRAAGCWQANSSESYCAYRSLAKRLA